MPQPQGLAPGVYPQLTFEEYHNDPAIGSSGIKHLLVSPRRYWFNSPLNPHRKIKKKTPALRFGTAFHAMILEPQNFGEQVAVLPKKWIKAKDHPEGLSMEKQENLWREENAHKTVITQDDLETMQEMLYAIGSTPEHMNALRGGVQECSVFWRDEESGLMCKIRLDNFTPEWGGDLKSTMSIENKNLRYEFPKRGYDISGSMYAAGMMELKKMITAGYQLPAPFTPEFTKVFMSLDQQHFCFVFQEKEYPYITRLWRMTPWSTEIGLSKFRNGLAVYFENKNRPDAWPSNFPAVEDIEESMVSASINY